VTTYGKKQPVREKGDMRFFRRRKFIIDKKLQYSLFFISLTYAALFFLVFALSLFVPLTIIMDTHGETEMTATQAATIFLFLHENIWLPGLIGLLAIGFHSIRTSHKIAGPLYRFNTVLKSVKQGVIPAPMDSLRKGDYLHGEFELINQMLETLRENIKDIRTADSSLNKSISLCMNGTDHMTKEELLEKLKDIAGKEERLGKKIGYFTIAS
jgi:hypothetical protein